jgi:hypothetical protein
MLESEESWLLLSSSVVVYASSIVKFDVGSTVGMNAYIGFMLRLSSATWSCK